METQLTHTEAKAVKDLRIAELLETISTLKATLEECLDFVTEKHDFDKPKNKTACLISSIDEAIYQADEVTK
jgi:hypothetical protein